MKLATVRDFKTNATQYLGSSEEVVVTRYGKPVAILTPVRPESADAVLLELRGVLQEAKVSKKELLGLLREAQAEVYGH